MTRVGALFERGAEGVWVGTCPSVPGAFAQGPTLASCRRKLGDAIASLLEYAPAGDLEDLREAETRQARAELLDVAIPERRSEQLLTQADIARTAGVTRQAVHRWVSRSDFPRPATRTDIGPLWSRSDVLRWLASGRRTAGRPSFRGSWPAGAASGRSKQA